MTKRALFLTIFFFPLYSYAQSIIGTWHMSGLSAFEESVKEQKLIVTKDSIIFRTKSTKYDYQSSPDSTDEYAYIKTNERDTVESIAAKIAAIKTDKLTDRGYLIIETPKQVSSKEKTTYSVIRYIFTDENNCKLAVASKDFIKSKKEAEKVYKDLRYQDLYYLISEARAAHLATLKNPELITKEDLLVVLTELRSYFANLAATMDNSSKKDESMYMNIMTGVVEKVGNTLEGLGYNPISSMKLLESVGKKYEDDPQIKRVMEEIDQIMDGK